MWGGGALEGVIVGEGLREGRGALEGEIVGGGDKRRGGGP